MKVLFVSPEVVPFAKTGGLADVSGALPKFLADLGIEVSVMMPLYRKVRRSGIELRDTGTEVAVSLNQNIVKGRVLRSTLPGSKVPVYLLENDRYYDREELYGTAKGDFPDNCERFVFFCRGVMEAIKNMPMDLDLIHANDWQTGLLPVYLKTLYKHHERTGKVAAVFSVHNLAYQGLFWHWDVPLTGLSWDLFNYRELEFFGKINLLKGGLVFADLISTVSETYAKEIQTPEFGYGLEGVLAWRSKDLYGIVNGADYSEWNPATDNLIPARYSPKDLRGKAVCKEALQKASGLPLRREVPIIGSIGRLSDQKGLDTLADAMGELMKMDVQLVILGTGQQKYHDLLENMAEQHKDKLRANIKFDNQLAHLIEAGSDMFLMPSHYEPCGLNQMYSMKYGTVPIVRRTGGLADSVVAFSPERLSTGEATGFLFDKPTAEALLAAIREAVSVYHDRESWKKLMLNGLAQDWSWNRSARKYKELYEKAIQKKQSEPK